MVSITDVAKKAGCSATLVSRVVNNQYGVSENPARRYRQRLMNLGTHPMDLPDRWS